MNSSWHVGRLAGIDIRIHWSFLLLPVWVYFSSLFAGSGMAAAVAAVIFVLAIFICVVLHELGHALAARYFGIGTHDITLLPIGGLARLEAMPKNPTHELVIAVAGPAVNVMLAVAVVLVFTFGSGLLTSSPVITEFLTKMALVNVVLAIFNMIPAFPMDGGRVLRAVLAMRMPYAKATHAAATVGQIAAVGLGLLGVASGNLILLLVAAFVFLAARGEAKFVAAQEQPWQPRAASPASGDGQIFCQQAVPTLESSWSADSALHWIAEQPGKQYPVLKNGSVVGFVSRSDIIRAIVGGYGRLPLERMLSVRFMPAPENGHLG